MFKVKFKEKYKILHLTSEIGDYCIGGAGTYMNEIYENKSDDMGFVYVHSYDVFQDIDVNKLPGEKDIIVMHKEECSKLLQLDFDILVVHFYDLFFCITKELLNKKKVVYVIHSVPTPEPMPTYDPFGGNFTIRYAFEQLCEHSNLIICVSDAERKKLLSIYPRFDDKTKVVYNGITKKSRGIINTNYKSSRQKFGFIGRIDYRKGILEMFKEFVKIDGELYIACVDNDPFYMSQIINYLEAVDMKSRVHFLGWCVGKRKENFFEFIDALIIPSLYEPFGYVVLEAMQYSVPIICSSNGGLKEIIGEYKYQYNPYIEGELLEQIICFKKDSNDIIDKQQEMLSKRAEEFTSKKMSERYSEIWNEL